MDETKLFLSSVPLLQVDKSNMPIGIASGCIVKYPAYDYLLTVFHAASRIEGRWVVPSEWIPKQGLKLISCGTFSFQRLVNIVTGEATDIDFAYAAFPKDQENYYQEMEMPQSIRSSTKRTKHDHRRIGKPVKNVDYGFSGQVMPEIVGGAMFVTQNSNYQGIKYIETRGQFHCFRLPFKHPGDEHFHGCSGAPIIDDMGNIVALVCSGDTDTDEIYGVDLHTYKIGIEIEDGMHG